MGFLRQVRYLTDDRDLRKRHELVISRGANGDWYVSVVAEGDVIGPSVRLCTSGGASSRVPGLTVAISQAFRALANAAPVIDGVSPGQLGYEAHARTLAYQGKVTHDRDMGGGDGPTQRPTDAQPDPGAAVRPTDLTLATLRLAAARLTEAVLDCYGPQEIDARARQCQDALAAYDAAHPDDEDISQGGQ